VIVPEVTTDFMPAWGMELLEPPPPQATSTASAPAAAKVVFMRATPCCRIWHYENKE